MNFFHMFRLIFEDDLFEELVIQRIRFTLPSTNHLDVRRGEGTPHHFTTYVRYAMLYSMNTVHDEYCTVLTRARLDTVVFVA